MGIDTINYLYYAGKQFLIAGLSGESILTIFDFDVWVNHLPKITGIAPNISHHIINENQLYLHDLEVVHAKNIAELKPIGDVHPVSHEKHPPYFVYNLNIKETLTGGMVIGYGDYDYPPTLADELDVIHHYDLVYEIIFKDGVIQEVIDHSQTAKQARAIAEKHQGTVEKNTAPHKRLLKEAFTQNYLSTDFALAKNFLEE